MKIAEPYILDDTQGFDGTRTYTDYSPTLRSECHGLSVVEPMIAAMRGREPSVLTPKRTEHGKAVRRDYESGAHKESRHTMQQLEPREDGVTNTLTTVQKDNLVIEPTVNIRVRKLTPKECWRLMGFTDEDFEKAQKALNNTFYKGKDKSSSQLYKMAGNSIVVNVMMAIFGTMTHSPRARERINNNAGDNRNNTGRA